MYLMKLLCTLNVGNVVIIIIIIHYPYSLHFHTYLPVISAQNVRLLPSL